MREREREIEKRNETKEKKKKEKKTEKKEEEKFSGFERRATWWQERVKTLGAARAGVLDTRSPLTVRVVLPPLFASSSLLLLRWLPAGRALLRSHEESRCAHVPATARATAADTSSSSRFTLSPDPVRRSPLFLFAPPLCCSAAPASSCLLPPLVCCGCFL